MQAEYDLDKLTVKRRGLLPELVGKDPKDAQIQVTLSLDADVVAYFQEQAAKQEKTSYKAQINQALRLLIGGASNIEILKNTLLQDRNFIEQLAKQVRE